MCATRAELGEFDLRCEIDTIAVGESKARPRSRFLLRFLRAECSDAAWEPTDDLTERHTVRASARSTANDRYSPRKPRIQSAEATNVTLGRIDLRSERKRVTGLAADYTARRCVPKFATRSRTLACASAIIH
ncbi:MAG TPA: hypothetical protein VMJ11_01625 [Paraburkholderia sp.]|uniref:hypothetical protein n=1 Tax=Paraburkholderia sp. TaxID=1926495 RepID=UPI002B90683E|nr:hypothetical protein [Paraburkholderia sp.]HTR05368.1 hypothetical protein [Paraburkholderia sp.]